MVLLGTIGCAVLVSWFGFRWQIGNMLGELTQPSQPDALEIARAAVELAPRDPLPRWLLATKLKEDFDDASTAESIRNFEDAVRRSPNDYRWWIELGRAYEQNGQVAEAEKALERAVSLAPEYTFPQWQVGNFYIRQDRVEEAFSHLTRTTEKSIVYREQVFALAWDYFDKSPAKVEQIAANTPSVRVSLAQFYAQRGAAADALRVWDTVPAEEKEKHPQIVRNITQHLFTKRFFRQTLDFARQSGIDPDVQFETVTNGGFEKLIGEVDGTLFGWRTNRADNKVEIQTDSNIKSEGQKSLKVVFKGYTKPDFYSISQLVAVQPQARYRLTFMLRIENLRSGGEPLFEVVDANSDVSIARTPRFALGSQDWHQVSIDFTVPEKCDGVTIRTARETCGENCPIMGTIWFDDFKLQRL